MSNIQKKATYVYPTYFQKSLNFLFPLLGFAKEDTYQPENTYLWYPGEESIDTLEMIVHYKADDSKLYSMFEQKVILENPHLEACYTVDIGKLYIFDMSHHTDTVEKFMRGKYSEFSSGIKKKILSYHGASLDKIPRPGRVFHTALYPELYMEQVAAEIGETVETLMEVGELCSPLVRSKETYTGKVVEKCEGIGRKKVISLEKK